MHEAGRPGNAWLLRQVHRAIRNGLGRLDFRPKQARRDVRTQLCIECGAGSRAVTPSCKALTTNLKPHTPFLADRNKRVPQVNPHYDYDASEELAPMQADERNGSTNPAPQAQMAESPDADRPAKQPAPAAEAGLTGGTRWLGANKVPLCQTSLCPACQCFRLAMQIWVCCVAASTAVE